MSHFTGYGAYVVFVTVRTHFRSPTFDMFKYHKVNAFKRTYEKRSDRWFFEKVAKDYNERDLADFFIANRLEDRNYITELLEDDAIDNFTKYKARRQSLSYIYTQNLDKAFSHGLNKPFEIVEGEYPYIAGLYLRKSISPETMVILNDYIPFFDKFDKYLGTNDVIWSKIALKLRRYKPFLKYDREKFKAILKEKIDEVTNG